MRNTSSLLILILATTIANVLEMSISPETGEANGGQMMNNASESYSAETVKDLSIIITYDNNGYQEGLKVKYVGPCHCSGDLARQMFKQAYRDAYIDVGVGRIIKF